MSSSAPLGAWKTMRRRTAPGTLISVHCPFGFVGPPCCEDRNGFTTKARTSFTCVAAALASASSGVASASSKSPATASSISGASKARTEAFIANFFFGLPAAAAASFASLAFLASSLALAARKALSVA